MPPKVVESEREDGLGTELELHLPQNDTNAVIGSVHKQLIISITI